MDRHLSPERLTRERIRQRLSRHLGNVHPHSELGDARQIGPAGVSAQRAAVLLPLYRLEGAWHLVFIRRAEHEQDRHSGQVGFPGGRWEDSDPDCIATALREAEEEISLPQDQVEVLGALRPMHTVSEFLVTPVVGHIPWPQALQPDPREVARIFSIPLAWLGHPGHHRVRPYPAPGHPQVRDVIFFDEYEGELLWGVTARITLDFIASLREP
jgi:8-oxo-dGTP pyrophosphatase MutT (NUDIX family)